MNPYADGFKVPKTNFGSIRLIPLKLVDTILKPTNFEIDPPTRGGVERKDVLHSKNQFLLRSKNQFLFCRIRYRVLHDIVQYRMCFNRNRKINERSTHELKSIVLERFFLASVFAMSCLYVRESLMI